MTGVSHGDRAHAKVSPSGTEKSINCPASIRRSEAFENKSSVFAKEGTSAHEFCELILRETLVKPVDPRDWLGGVIVLSGDKAGVYKRHRRNPHPDRDNVWRITDEHIDAANVWLATILPLVEPGVVVMIETKVDIRHVHPMMWGTADCIIYNPRTKKLWVIDLKFGSGIAVDPDWNTQFFSYGAGAAKLFNYDVSEVELVVVQPRAWHPKGPVRRFIVDIIDFLIFEGWMRKQLARVDDPEPVAAVGEWCRFCPAAPLCPDLYQFVMRTLNVKFTPKLRERDLPDLKSMSTRDLGRVFREMKIIEIWMNRFREYVHDRAMNGEIPEGAKVVEGRSIRHWKDPVAVQEELEALGFSDEEIFTEPDLRSPAGIETVMGKALFKKCFGEMVDKPRGRAVLALEGDHRPAVKVGVAGTGFGKVEDEDE
jgi:hypothetical protein